MNFSLHSYTSYICLLLTMMLSFTACQKEDSSTEPTITSFTVAQANNELIFTFSASSQDIQYYEITYYPPNGSSGGQFATNELSTITKTFAELSIQGGLFYVFNIQAILINGSIIYGSDPVTLSIGDFCQTPYDLSFTNAVGLNWSIYSNTTNPSYYELSYGLTGTTANTGTKITTNNRSNKEMTLEQGKVYDFYVRSYCNSTLGWSDWDGPLSYYASQSLNLCVPPTNLSFTVVRNGLSQAVGAACTWADNGNNNNYEVNMVGNGSSPTAGNIETSTNRQITYLPMVQNTEYDFYVRSICSDGTRTSWAGPLNVNIGQ